MPFGHLFHPVVLPVVCDQILHCHALLFVHQDTSLFNAEAGLGLHGFVNLRQRVHFLLFLEFTGAFALNFLPVQFFEFFFRLVT